MPTKQELLQYALALEPDERVEIADALWESVEGLGARQPTFQEEWIAEIERRMQSVANGTARLYSWSEVKSQIEERLRNIER